jgi:hypothetical protein
MANTYQKLALAASVILSVAMIKVKPTQASTFTFYSPGIYEFGLNSFTGEDSNNNGLIDLGELSKFYADLRQYWGPDALYGLSDVKIFEYLLGSNSLSYEIGDNNPKPNLYGFFGGLVTEIPSPPDTSIPEPSVTIGLTIFGLAGLMKKKLS